MGIYKLKYIEKSTGKITVIHTECGTPSETCLEHVENGIFPSKCPHVTIKTQRKIAISLRRHHLELVF